MGLAVALWLAAFLMAVWGGPDQLAFRFAFTAMVPWLVGGGLLSLPNY
jgi:hypothetical protein